MLNDADNERLTRVGPGTPTGELFRRYWIPAIMTSELPEADGAPQRVRLLGEDLIAFRDSDAKVGLVDAFCPHRRAPMFFGRNEECGLRCVYHGWKFDREGTCVDMPSEPPDSLFKTKVSIKAYPTFEAGGIVWTYMGAPEHMPPYPDHELVRAPETHRCISKTFQDCNYLQGLEGGLDPTHATILHAPRVGDLSFLRDFTKTAAEMEIEETGYGIFYAGIRETPEHETWVRGYHWIMPSFHMRAQMDATFWEFTKENSTIDGHIWIPIDDEHTWVYNFFYSANPDRPLSAEQLRFDETMMGRGPGDLLPGFIPKRNRTNDYMIDRQVQKTLTMTGIEGINTQDFAVQEEMGAIKDRKLEHLGTSDRVVILLRRLLMESLDRIDRGEAPRGTDSATYRDVRAIDRKVPQDRPWREQLESELHARF